MSILWSRKAHRQLIALLSTLSAERSKVLSDQIKLVQYALRTNPAGYGESRDRGKRIWFFGLVTLLYKIKTNGDVRVLEMELNDKAWPDYEE